MRYPTAGSSGLIGLQEQLADNGETVWELWGNNLLLIYLILFDKLCLPTQVI